MEESNEIIIETSGGKNIEVALDGHYGLWTITAHGTNLPDRLKKARYTSPDLAVKDVNIWVEAVKAEKQRIEDKPKAKYIKENS